MFLTITLLSILFCLIVSYLWTINNRYQYFKHRGIPGPPHRFFFGHYKNLWSTQRFSKLLQTWTCQYGSIYGLFEGTRPIYVVSDVHLLEEVHIKQFLSFYSHATPRIICPKKDEKIGLFLATGARWLRQKHVINPIFSSAKLKLMSSLMNGCIEAMLNKVSEITDSEDKDINIYELYK